MALLKTALAADTKKRALLASTIAEATQKRTVDSDLDNTSAVAILVQNLETLDEAMVKNRERLVDALQDSLDDLTTELKKAKRKGQLDALSGLASRAASVEKEIASLLELHPGHASKKRRKSASPHKRTSADHAGGAAAAAAAMPSGAGAAEEERTFAASHFRKAYLKARPMTFQDELFSALRELLLAYSAETGLDRSAATKFFEGLQAEAFKQFDELKLNQVADSCQRLWTSTLRYPGSGKELCSIINECIRRDSVRCTHTAAAVHPFLYFFLFSLFLYFLPAPADSDDSLCSFLFVRPLLCFRLFWSSRWPRS